MPIAKVQMPDGRIAKFEVPEGTTPEEVQAFAAKQIEPEKEEGGGLALSVGGGSGRGIAKALGAPVDIANLALSFFGAGSEQPFGGSRSIQTGMQKLGIGVGPDAELPNKFVGRVAEEVGAAAVPFGVVGGAARKSITPAMELVKNTGGRSAIQARKATSLEPSVVRSMGDFFRTRPGTLAATEAGAATSAGVGAAIANQMFPESELADITGQLIGGVASPTTLLSERAPAVVASTRRMFESVLNPNKVAARVVQGTTRGKPQDVAEAIERPGELLEGAVTTPAGKSGDAGMLALERALMKKSAGVDNDIKEVIATTNRTVREELSTHSGGSIENTKAFLTDRVDYLKELIGARASLAMRQARQALDNLSPNATREQANVAVRGHIDDALNDGRIQERELWNAVDNQIPSETSRGKEAYQRVIAGRDPDPDISNPDDIPDFVRNKFGAEKFDVDGNKIDKSFTETEPMGRLKQIRSRILSEIRAERGKEVPNRNKIRILSEIQDGVLEDMAAASDDPALSVARAFSSELNTRFTQGKVGQILGYQKTGEASIPAELTLERTIGQQGPAAGVGLDDLRAAGQPGPIGRGPEIDDAVADFMRERFMRKLAPEGKLNASTAKRFMLENRELLSRRPDLEREFQKAIDTEDFSQIMENSSTRRLKNIKQARKGAATTLLEAPVDREMKKVLSSQNPRKAMDELVRQSVKDRTGLSLEGLRSSFIDEMWSAGATKQLDVDGHEILSGRRMQEFLDKNSSVFKKSKLFTNNGRGRVNRIVTTARTIERELSAGRSSQEILDQNPDAIHELIVSVLGARAGAAIGGGTSGGSIQAAGRGAGFARKITEKIPFGKVQDVLEKAVFDEKLMVELLKTPITPDQVLSSQRAIRGFLINTIPEAVDSFDGITIEINKDANDLNEQALEIN